MKLLRNLIFFSFLLLLFSCAKNPEKMQHMTIKEIFSLNSSPTDFDIHGDLLFTTEQDMGFTILNNKTGEIIHRINSGMEYDDYGNQLPDQLSIYQVHVIRYVSKLQTLFIADRTVSSRVYVYRYNEENNTINQVNMYIGATSTIRDIIFEDNHVQPNTCFYYWGFFRNSRNNIRKGLFNSNDNSYDSFVQTKEVPNAVHSLVMTDNHIISAMGQRGIYITNKELENEVVYNTAGEARDLVIKGNTLFVADRSAGVQIIDITNITDPHHIKNIPLNGNAISVDIFNDYLAIGTTNGNIYLFNVANRTNPVMIDCIKSLIEVFKVKFHRNELYVASRLGIIKITF